MEAILMLAICQQEDARRVPRNRLTTSRSNAFNLSDEAFVSNFRLTKALASQLIQELNPFLEPKTLKKTALSSEVKVLCALHFFATGCSQKTVGNDFYIKVSQSSASNCIQEVSEAMSTHLLRKYVQFPSDLNSQKALKKEFLEYCGLKGVLGAIDCTHVAIIAPPDDGYHEEKNYVNTQGWHSINVQLVCDMNLLIRNVVARFPGCTDDSYIWFSCNLKKAFDSGSKLHGDGWLLGDSAYDQEDHLHVPYTMVSPGSDEEAYNLAHSRGRSVIKRCNGMLKNRFRCLLKHTTLHYMPEAACKITNACVILHNMCVAEKLYWEDVDLPVEDELFDTTTE